jgi:hypothetical protein
MEMLVMKTCVMLIGLVAILASGGALAAEPTEDDARQPAAPALRVTLLTQSVGFTHGVVKSSGDEPNLVEKTWQQLADENSFKLTIIRDATKLPDLLPRTEVLVMYTTGNLPLNDEQFAAFEKWIRDGGGVLGIHPATDTWKKHDRWPGIIGGTFNGHPWNAGDTVTIKVLDPQHPATAHLDPSMTFKEEIYQFSGFEPEKVRVLIGLDMEKTAKKKPYFVPIAWVKQLDKGRVFYTSLGHREDIWAADWYHKHLVQAALWSAGRIDGDATPNPELTAKEDAKAKAAAR